MTQAGKRHSKGSLVPQDYICPNAFYRTTQLCNHRQVGKIIMGKYIVGKWERKNILW